MARFVIFLLLFIWLPALDAEGSCEKLQEKLLMLKGVIPAVTEIRAKGSTVLNLIQSECAKNYDQFDREFPFKLLGYLSTLNLNPTDPRFGKTKRPWYDFVEFEKDEIDDIRHELYIFFLSHRFTLRHYSNFKTNIIQSKFTQLLMSGMKNGGKFSSDYWLTLGATGFTDWTLCIDGKCPNEEKTCAGDSYIKFYDEFEIDFIDIFDKGLGDAEFLATKALSKELENIRHTVKIDIIKGKLVFLPEILFGYLYRRKGVSKAWLSLMQGKGQVKTILDTIEDKLPSLNIMLPGSIAKTSWIANDRVVKRQYVGIKKLNEKT